ncbi:MAG: 5-formyltetrahydrofolate cyclo-ligase [Novosphingobium sp.]
MNASVDFPGNDPWWSRHPSPSFGAALLQAKSDLRREMRVRRNEFVASIPEKVRALVFSRPPGAVVDFLREYRVLGFYHAIGSEAPSVRLARWFHENGWQIALPCFSDRSADMEFRIWSDPWDEDSLEPDPFGARQLRSDAPLVGPDALVVPLVAFTAQCHRLGQGGGHYDRWTAAHHPVRMIGLAWDVQRVEALPLEPHDAVLDAVVTPTQIYWKDA